MYNDNLIVAITSQAVLLNHFGGGMPAFEELMQALPSGF